MLTIPTAPTVDLSIVIPCHNEEDAVAGLPDTLGPVLRSLNSHAPVELLRPGIDIVTASPYHPDGGVDGVAAYRLVLSRGSSLIYRLLVGSDLHTYTALFRAYRRDVVRSVEFRADGFLAVAEILVNAI